MGMGRRNSLSKPPYILQNKNEFAIFPGRPGRRKYTIKGIT